MKNKSQFIILLLALFLLSIPTFSQQEVVLTIKEGVPAISIALPSFILDSSSPEVKQAAETIHEVLKADLNYSRIFQLVPQEHLNYIRPLNPKEIFFKDWDSIQARILVAGEVSQSQNKIIFEAKVYDIKSERMILGKRFQADPEVFRLVAHRLADELLKLFGEKPFFTTKIVFVSNRDGNDELYMMDYDGANQTRLTFNKWRDYMPAWSPDQRAIVFTSYRAGNPDLYILYPYKGKMVPVSTKGTNFSGAFSPDGKKLAFCSTRDGNAEIYVANADGTNIRRITFNSAIDTAPSWSPTGREIAFTSDRTGSPQIYIMDSEGGNVRKVSFGGDYLDSPAWSPDGERIAFVSRVNNFFDIYILNLKTNQITKLTETNARNESPSWSLDGRHLVFSSNLSGSIQIYSIDYDGTNLRCLTSKGENKLPNWTN
ncbi:MAG TPA: Tol-Pal system beta propeller repeat protein TolB [Candidatus Aminicenantes bacterium]|nr:MAG: Tol-Pal system beta propeller repeat protein TolB [Candidatus Aminicenantes bacterium]HEK85050.1 Tol-Pal system beta propeller repeat protein TolB [Candidatus Aminicenantes bacterium]